MTEMKKTANFRANILFATDAIELIPKIKIAIEDLIE
jgi:hypothetical protein